MDEVNIYISQSIRVFLPFRQTIICLLSCFLSRLDLYHSAGPYDLIQFYYHGANYGTGSG
jgi:hypothetical protein